MSNPSATGRMPGKFLLLLIVFLIVSPAAHAAARPEYRALWVDVFHDGIKSQAQVDTLLKTARGANYNALIIQVRKACDAFYSSTIEPKSDSISPGFDPLASVIAGAHDTSGGKQRIEVHAWLVAYRCRMPYDDLWKNPRHVFQRRPEWLNQTNKGAKEVKGEQAGRYHLDPGVPQVIDYNLEVVRDILSRYDVDGIHFDYIRYPESAGPGNIWGYNPTSVARFQKIYDRADTPAPDDPQWSEFRRQQVTFQVRKAYAHVRAWRPNVKVSAATIAWSGIDKGFERSSAYTNILQDWQQMSLDGWLDLIIPMNYKRERIAEQARDHRAWAQFLGNLSTRSGRFGLNGVDGEELNTLPNIVSQMSATRNMPGIAGIATYCYAQTRAGKSKPPDVEFFETIRKTFYSERASIPDAKWLSNPSDGLVKGVVTMNQKVLDGAVVHIGNRTAVTDGTGFYALNRLARGEHRVSVEWNGTRSTPIPFTLQPGVVSEVPIALK